MKHRRKELIHLPFLVALFCIKLPSSQSLSPHSSSSFSFWIERAQSTEDVLEVLAFRAMGPEADSTVFKEQLRKRMPKSLQKFQATGGKTIQFASKCQSSESTTMVVGAVDAKFQSHCRSAPLGSTGAIELPNRMHIKNLRVDPSYQRKGIGTALIRAVEEFSLKEYPAIPVEALTLLVDREKKQDAVKLYEREGFVFLEETGKGLMIKTLGG